VEDLGAGPGPDRAHDVLHVRCSDSGRVVPDCAAEVLGARLGPRASYLEFASRAAPDARQISAPLPTQETYVPLVFGDCLLDADRRELRRGSDAAPVGPQVFDLLLYLVETRARVVTKDDLLEAVWRGRIVSESTITSHINAARTAIGDDGQAQRLIRTVPRKGFRFVGEVTDAEPAHRDADETPSARAHALPDKPSIAVLPFVNLSGDPEQDYFADGVVEDVTTALSHIRWLFVIARNSSFTYKGRAVDVTQVGRELGVRYVLEGSVRKAANRVRITGQLVDAATGGHLWA